MSNDVTIACLSDSPLIIDPDLDTGAAVDLMIDHWKDRLYTVLPDRPDLIVLPECCDRPATDHYPPEQQREFLERRGDLVLELFADTARKHRCHIAYSGHRIDSDGRAFNSTRIIGRDGTVAGAYDKNFLTINENSRSGLTYGTTLPAFDLDFGRVVAIICFDLNFEEIRQQCEVAEPDVIVFSSAYHGGLMQAYWAYTCRAYFATSVYPPAPSGIVSPVGETVAETTNYRHEVVHTVNLDAKVVHIDYNAEAFSKIKNAYGPAVRIHDPGRLGSVLVSAEADDLTVDDVVNEFGLELLPDYMNRVRAHRNSQLGIGSSTAG